MPLHIILEGSDKVGKSTVAQILSMLLGLPIIKMPDMPRYFKEGRQEEASEVFNKAIVQFAHTSFIMDRGYPSSMVYSQHFRRNYDLSYLDDIIRKLDARIYVLSVPSRADDDVINQRDQHHIRDLYDKLAKEKGWVIIDCVGLTPTQIADEIIKDINKWTRENISSGVE